MAEDEFDFDDIDPLDAMLESMDYYSGTEIDNDDDDNDESEESDDDD